MLITNEQIKEYIKKHLSPKDVEKIMVKSRYADLSSMLRGNNIQSGSFARFTSITPVNDLDVIWELPEDILEQKGLYNLSLQKTISPVELDVSDILSDLANKISLKYNEMGVSVMKIEAQSHSVGIYFGPTEDDFSIDVVPAIINGKNEYNDHVYVVPEIVRQNKKKRKSTYKNQDVIKWVKSDPRGYIKEAVALNEINDGYRHATKFLKKWKCCVKQRHPDIEFKSFHIEMIVKKIVLDNPQLNTVEIITKILGDFSLFVQTPKIIDRANSTRYIDGYLSELSDVQKNILINEASRLSLQLDNISTQQSVDAQLDIIFNNQSYSAGISNISTHTRVVAPISRPYACV